MKTKILVLASNPEETARLRLDKEIAEIEDILERSKQRDSFTLKAKLAVRVRDLQESILKEKPRIVHFCGHGAGSEGLILEAESGEYQLVNNQALGGLFKLFETQLECVMLNACYSQVQAKEIHQHINYVIGTKKQIQDRAAISFTKGFYTALFNGEAIERAYEFGCNRIQLDIYGSRKRDRKFVPVYSEEKGDLIELPQDEVLVLLKKEPLNEIEVETVYGERAESRGDSPRNITVYGNYVEELQGNYNQGSYGESLQRRGKPFQVPPLPSHFVERPEVSQELKKRLLEKETNHSGTLVISAIHGLGGIGKTILAQALAYDRQVQERFCDGILWAT